MPAHASPTQAPFAQPCAQLTTRGWYKQVPLLQMPEPNTTRLDASLHAGGGGSSQNTPVQGSPTQLPASQALLHSKCTGEYEQPIAFEHWPRLGKASSAVAEIQLLWGGELQLS